jgi:hypothetical protein
MARHLRAALNHVKVRLRGGLNVDVDELARQEAHQWRQRKLTPAVTIYLFMLQILNGNVAISALRHLSGISIQASSYCAARMRLPLTLFTRLFDAVSQAANDVTAGSLQTLLITRRVLVADGSSFSMPDTPQLQQAFGSPIGQQAGCSFPVGKLLGVIDALTGAILLVMGGPLFMNEAPQMLALNPMLRRGDVLVGDRAFCSYAQIGWLLAGGVDTVLRLHQRRPTRASNDWIETWTRPLQWPDWISRSLWQSLPPTLAVRIVRYAVPGRKRSRFIYVATTLLDPIAYPRQTILRLYGHRWNIETCFNQLKTHAKMNTLKSQSVDGVIKELIMYLIVWNLVRMTMAKFAQKANTSVWRVSFIDTMRCLCALFQNPLASQMKPLINPDRADRWEPRKIKRRLKEYGMLNQPRAILKANHSARYA